MDTLLYIMTAAILICVIILLVAVLSRKNNAFNTQSELRLFQTTVHAQLEEMKIQSAENASQLRQEVIKMFSLLGGNFSRTLAETTVAHNDNMDKLRQTVDQKLKELSDINEKRLEQIRKTVDEQLHDMLQKRLTGSFKQVSDQLEQVFKSMGEVRSLATGVGDLKRVLTNVKVRGTWGEMQLGSLLSSMLSPVQYLQNASVNNTQDRVEYAIVLPGSGEDTVLLPIDSKFPMEAFIRKEEILEAGSKDLAKDAMRALAKCIITEARRIRDKYINPPITTDFAIMYLPTEGLYADAITLGVSDICQREYHVTISGPSTLTALLNSLQMGFRTLAIEQQSGEVLRLLESTKKAFSNFSSAIDKTKKSLSAAQNNLEDASRKSRTIERQLDRAGQFDSLCIEE